MSTSGFGFALPIGHLARVRYDRARIDTGILGDQTTDGWSVWVDPIAIAGAWGREQGGLRMLTTTRTPVVQWWVAAALWCATLGGLPGSSIAGERQSPDAEQPASCWRPIPAADLEEDRAAGLRMGIPRDVIEKTLKRHAEVIGGKEHYREIWMALDDLRRAAVARSDVPLAASPGEPRVLTTSAGLMAIYTITVSDGVFVHLVSVSIPGHTPNAFGQRFLCMITDLLGIRDSEMEIYVSPSTAHYTTARLSPAEQRDFLNRSIRDPSDAGLDSLCHVCIDALDRVNWIIDSKHPLRRKGTNGE